MAIIITSPTLGNDLSRYSNFFSPAHSGDLTLITWVKNPIGGDVTNSDGLSILDLIGADNNNGATLERLSPTIQFTGGTGNLSASGFANSGGSSTSIEPGLIPKGDWHMYALVHDSTAVVPRLYVYDMDGVQLYDSIAGADINPTGITDFYIYEGIGISSADPSGAGFRIATMSVHTVALTETDLDDIAANRNILTNYTTGLEGYWSTFTDWSTTGNVLVDESGNGKDMPANANWVHSVDIPGEVIGITGATNKYNGHDIDAVSLETGTLYAVRKTQGSAVPTIQEVKDGIIAGDLLEATNTAVTSGVGVTLPFSTASTFTSYDYYFVLNFSGGDALLDQNTTLTTTGLATATLADVNGVARPNLANIKFAWFDQTTGDTLTTPTTAGTTSTDGSGNIFISLDGSSLTATQTGRLDIDAVDGADTYTASYFLTVS